MRLSFPAASPRHFPHRVSSGGSGRRRHQQPNCFSSPPLRSALLRRDHVRLGLGARRPPFVFREEGQRRRQQQVPAYERAVFARICPSEPEFKTLSKFLSGAVASAFRQTIKAFENEKHG